MKPNGLPCMCLALAFLVLSHTREASGTPDDPTATVPASHEQAPSGAYDAPAECPSRSEFFDLVAARGVTLQDAGDMPTFSIAITRTSQQFVGRLAIKDSAGSVPPFISHCERVGKCGLRGTKSSRRPTAMSSSNSVEVRYSQP